MTTRERWVVYPLLFLTLGIALKDKIIRQVSTGKVECRALVVTDGLGNQQVVLAANPDGGIVRANSAKGGVDVSIGHFGSTAGLLMTGPQGNLLRGSRLIQTLLPQPPQEPAGEEPQLPSPPDEPRVDAPGGDS